MWDDRKKGRKQPERLPVEHQTGSGLCFSSFSSLFPSLATEAASVFLLVFRLFKAAISESDFLLGCESKDNERMQQITLS